MQIKCTHKQSLTENAYYYQACFLATTSLLTWFVSCLTKVNNSHFPLLSKIKERGDKGKCKTKLRKSHCVWRNQERTWEEAVSRDPDTKDCKSPHWLTNERKPTDCPSFNNFRVGIALVPLNIALTCWAI